MSILSRLLGRPDPREDLRPLWDRVVALAREPGWYTRGGVADSVAGRFDMVTLVLALVMLRMERDKASDDALVAPSAHLTELFVHDMDSQLRQSGVGDLVVGKRIGQLMSALAGRIAALRSALGEPDRQAALVPVVERNVTMAREPDAAWIAGEIAALFERIDAASDADLLAGRIADDRAA